MRLNSYRYMEIYEEKVSASVGLAVSFVLIDGRHFCYIKSVGERTCVREESSLN
jgi:hypothetical protein